MALIQKYETPTVIKNRVSNVLVLEAKFYEPTKFVSNISSTAAVLIKC